MVFNQKYGVYVTKSGLVFKVAQYESHGHTKGTLYIMPTAIDKASGYSKVTIYDPATKKSRPVAVHQLVAETFLQNPEGKRYIDHIDRNKLNNDVSNLRYVTQAENNMNSNRSDRAYKHYGFRPSENRRLYKTIWAREHYTSKCMSKST